MPERSTDFRQTAKSAVQQAKQRIGIGDPPLASEVGGRVEAVREALRAFGEGEIDRFIEAFHEEVEWVAPKGENFPGSGTRAGRDSIREHFVGTVKRSYASFGFEPQRYLEAPEENWVVVLGAFAGEGVKGKGRFDAPAVQVWEFDGDAVVRVQIYADAESFPPSVSEEEEQEEKKAAEAEDSAEGDGESTKSDESSESEAKAKSDGSAESDGSSESEGKAKSDQSSESESKAESDESSEGDDDAGKGEASGAGDRGSARGEATDDSDSGDANGSSKRQESAGGAGPSSEHEG
jgi:ketosteroid isomerase-like protein